MKTKTTTTSHKGGSIAVTLTEPKRMEAILALAQANLAVANALQAPPYVCISNCTITSCKGNGVEITSE